MGDTVKSITGPSAAENRATNQSNYSLYKQKVATQVREAGGTQADIDMVLADIDKGMLDASGNLKGPLAESEGLKFDSIKLPAFDKLMESSIKERSLNAEKSRPSLLDLLGR